MVNILDKFFELGNKATRNDPLRKSQYDYYLYAIVFLAFVGIAITYFYNFLFGGAKFSTLLWGVVVLIFCWFNYWGLIAFRGIYINMKAAKETMAKLKEPKELDVAFDEMMQEFKDEHKKRTNRRKSDKMG